MWACDVDWQPIATLVTGLLAVGAALYVGRKQVEIATRQAGIAQQQAEVIARQVKLAELGPDAYGSYCRRVPMLVPFLPRRPLPLEGSAGYPMRRRRLGRMRS